MSRCKNEIMQTVPTRYSAKLVPGRCGQTGIYGDPIYCDSCSARHDARGHAPWQCSHGVDMRPEGAVCMACEFGE
jgi:hypothetical protein